MATTTTNYGLTKPSYNDSADISVINSNMDIIDSKMKEIEDAGGGGGTPSDYEQVKEQVNTNKENITNLQSDVGTLGTEVNRIKSDIDSIISQTDVIKNADVDDDILTDSADAPIKDIKIYGKCVQDGTPIPESPVEIQSVVNPKIIISNSDSSLSQEATLTYTLNAIPVSEDGNVTINGQQYIVDYVDIENKKLVKCVNKIKLTEASKWNENNDNGSIRISIIDGINDDNLICSHLKVNSNRNALYNNKEIGIIGNYIYNQIGMNFGLGSLSATNEFIQNNDVYVYYQLANPTEIDLTDEEVKTFLTLHTYVPTTNIIVTSDDLDGACEFIYYVNGESGQEIGKLLSKIGQEDISSVGANVTDAINKLASAIVALGGTL